MDVFDLLGSHDIVDYFDGGDDSDDGEVNGGGQGGNQGGNPFGNELDRKCQCSIYGRGEIKCGCPLGVCGCADGTCGCSREGNEGGSESNAEGNAEGSNENITGGDGLMEYIGGKRKPYKTTYNQGYKRVSNKDAYSDAYGSTAYGSTEYNGGGKRKPYKTTYNQGYKRVSNKDAYDNAYGSSKDAYGKAENVSASNMVKSQTDLINSLDPNLWYHLAREPLHDHTKAAYLHNGVQAYVVGQNSVGRPSGFWIAPGNKWMKTIAENKGKQFAGFEGVCCYLYRVVINVDIKLVMLHNKADLVKFHNDYASYWINFNVFNENEAFEMLADSKRDYELYYKKLKNKGVILDTEDELMKAYPKTKKQDVEKLKFINWYKVSKDFDGVYFSYAKETQHIYDWYDVMDIESACIWNVPKLRLVLNAIKSSKDRFVAIPDGIA